MSTTPRMTSYTICVNIMWLLFLTCTLCGSPQAYAYDRLKDACTGCGDVYNTKAHILHHVFKHHANLFWSVPCVAKAHGQSHHLGTHYSSTFTMYMPCTGCGKVINNPKFLATIIWSMHDRLKDACTGCEDVYNTKEHIVHHVFKHHANWFWSVPCVADAQRQSNHLGTHDSYTCTCLALDVSTPLT